MTIKNANKMDSDGVDELLLLNYHLNRRQGVSNRKQRRIWIHATICYIVLGEYHRLI